MRFKRKKSFNNSLYRNYITALLCLPVSQPAKRSTVSLRSVWSFKHHELYDSHLKQAFDTMYRAVRFRKAKCRRLGLPLCIEYHRAASMPVCVVLAQMLPCFMVGLDWHLWLPSAADLLCFTGTKINTHSMKHITRWGGIFIQQFIQNHFFLVKRKVCCCLFPTAQYHLVCHLFSKCTPCRI